MFIILKVAVAVAALVSSLMGIWQAADRLELQPYLTLPGYEPYLALFGLGPPKSSSDLNGRQHMSETSNYADSIEKPVVVEDGPLIGIATDHPSFAVTGSKISSAYRPSTPTQQSWENVGPCCDEEAAPSGQVFLDKLASFSAVFDYLFSFVRERPTSALEALQFGLVAVFVIGCVFSIGTALYWSLLFIDLRALTRPNPRGALTNTPEPPLPVFQTDEPNILSVISDIVQSVSKNTPNPESDFSFAHTLALEVLTFAGEIAQARSDAAKEDLILEIGKSVDATKAGCERMSKQGSDLERSLRAQFNDAIKEHENQIREVKKELDSTFKCGLDSWVSKFESRLDSKLDSKFDSKLDSKLDSLNSKFDSKLDSILKPQADIIMDSRASIDLLSKQISTKVALEDFARLQDTMVRAQQDLDLLARQMPAKVAMDDFARLQDTMAKSQQDLDSLAREMPAKVAMGDFAGLRDAMVRAQQDLDLLAREMPAKAAMEDVARLQDTMAKTQQDLDLLARQMPAKVAMEDFARLQDTMVRAQQDLDLLARQMAGKVAMEDLSRMEDKMTDIVTKAQSELRSFERQLSTKAGAAELLGLEKIVGKAQSEVRLATEWATNEGAEPTQPQSAPQQQPSPPPSIAKTVAHPRTPETAEQGSNFHVPGIKINPESKAQGNAEMQKSRYATQQPILPPSSPKTVAHVDSPATVEQRSNLHMPSIKINPESKAQGSAEMQKSRYATQQPILPPSSPKTVAHVDSPATVEQRSNLHMPSIKINPESKAQGSAEMLKSRYATQQSTPLSTNITTPVAAEQQSNFHVPEVKVNLESKAQGSAEMLKSRYATQQPMSTAKSIVTPAASEQQSNLYVPEVKVNPESKAQGAAEMLKSRYATQQPTLTVKSITTPAASEQQSSLHVPEVKVNLEFKAQGAAEMLKSRYANHQSTAEKSITTSVPAEQRSNIYTPPVKFNADSSRLGSGETSKSRPALQQDASNVTVSVTPQTLNESSRSDVNNVMAASPTRPKGPKYPYGQGPGPNGGQKKQTASKKEHDMRRRNLNEMKKVLARFTVEQQEHARHFQDPITAEFAQGSGWEWINPTMKHAMRARDLYPPMGWTPPPTSSSSSHLLSNGKTITPHAQVPVIHEGEKKEEEP